MVQYILTPWRDRRELLKVRQQFYPAAAPLPAASAAAASAVFAAGAAPTTTAAAAVTAVAGPAAADAPALPTQPTRPTPSTPTPAPAPAPATRPSASHHAPATASTIGSSSGIGSGSGSDGSSSPLALAAQHHAVARVSMWMQRGNCPHMVESTALLTAAILSDGEGSGSAGTYAARAAYAAAFSRFVTGLLDGHQDKQRKLSMYSVAKTIGLPATFVELRHQATHEQLPSLAKLRSAARKALAWIWEYYWQHLGGEEGEGEAGGGDAAADAYREMVMRYLEERDAARKADLRKQLEGLDEGRLLRTLSQITEAPPNNAVMLGALRLSREILQEWREGEAQEGEASKDVEQVRKEISRSRDVLMSDAKEAVETSADEPEPKEGTGIGWAKYEGTWKPRPIGVA